MIKREYTYFVAYQIHNYGHKRQCWATVTRHRKIESDQDLVGVAQLITEDSEKKDIECTKVIFTSITLLSSKWVWK